MVSSVVISEFLSLLAKVLLHERIDDQLLADGVAGDFPSQLARPALLRIGVAGALDVLVIISVHLPQVKLSETMHWNWESDIPPGDRPQRRR